MYVCLYVRAYVRENALCMYARCSAIVGRAQQTRSVHVVCMHVVRPRCQILARPKCEKWLSVAGFTAVRRCTVPDGVTLSLVVSAVAATNIIDWHGNVRAQEGPDRRQRPTETPGPNSRRCGHDEPDRLRLHRSEHLFARFTCECVELQNAQWIIARG